MAGITPLEGQEYITEVLYTKSLGPQNLVIGLFVNTPGQLVEASAWGDIIQASGNGYAEVNLDSGSFTALPGGVATYPSVSWIATAVWLADVYGYYVRTAEVSPRCKHFEYSPKGPFTMTTDKIYTVDFSTNTETA